MSKFYNASPTSVTASTLVAGSLIPGATLFVGSDFSKVASLVALAAFTANTSSITAAPAWQGSNDGTTWVRLYSSNGAAAVAVTATAPAASATFSFDGPANFAGWRYVRFCWLTGGATGGAADVGTIAYNYRQLTGAEGGYA